MLRTSVILGQADDDCKLRADLAAAAALAGFELHPLSSGGWLLCRAGAARALPDLAAVAALLRQLGAGS